MQTFQGELQYLGTHYHGLQKQLGVKTIQGEIERVLTEEYPGYRFFTQGASRTDAGVHARQNFIKISLEGKRTAKQLEDRINKALPDDIFISNLRPCHQNKNIAHHPIWKEYHYYFSHGPFRFPLSSATCTHIHQQLDLERMHSAAQVFVGAHSFHNYQYKSSSKTMERTIYAFELEEVHSLNGAAFRFRVQGQSFLRYMVRLMVGALFNVGQTLTTREEIEESLLESSDLKLGFIAPARGLVLEKICYPSLKSY